MENLWSTFFNVVMLLAFYETWSFWPLWDVLENAFFSGGSPKESKRAVWIPSMSTFVADELIVLIKCLWREIGTAWRTVKDHYQSISVSFLIPIIIG